MHRYLVWFEESGDGGDVEGLDALDVVDEAVELADGLWLVRSSATRSRLYHQVKWTLAPDTPLLAAPLSDWPKFRGLSAGSLAWIRRVDGA